MYFIFPILTSLSFYEKPKLNYQENYENNVQLSIPQNVSISRDITEQHGNIENIDINDGIETIETIEDTFETTRETTDKRRNKLPPDEIEKQFSIKQSNTLFFLFCLSSSLCIFADLHNQWTRGR